MEQLDSVNGAEMSRDRTNAWDADKTQGKNLFLAYLIVQ
jgi:hypothetical protein